MTRAAPLAILVNAVHSKSGGGLTYLRNLLPLLGAEFELHVAIQADQESEVRPICAQAGLTLHVIPTLSKLATVLIQEQVTIPRLARRIGAAVIFSPANYGPVFGGRSVILLRNAFEVTTLEQRLSKRAYWLAVKLLTWACFKTCRRAMVVSAHAGRAFLKVFGLGDDPRLCVVHHGVGPAFHPPAEDDIRVAGRLLAVSDIYVQKSFETLLRALARLRPDHPGLHLHIAGRELDPAYAASLRALCDELGVADAVFFLGGLPPERVAALYREARVFVFPSLVETFGNPLVEAMASGIPVVCTDAAAMPEVVGDAALLARPRDDAHMARQIARLLDDRDLWRVMSAKGLARAGDFSWGKTAALTAAVLREAAKD
ncbi:MAG: glycosyltransferase family 1 protein [Phaeospirillum sp.]|nr:glycosyltransferase family 1 protein [Phaeospirillum sp.]